MKLIALVLLLLVLHPVSGATQRLDAPDPAQMEKASDLGYVPVEHGMAVPDHITLGALASVAFTRDGHLLLFNRGRFPLLEFAPDGKFVRSLDTAEYTRPHGLRVDAAGNIWTTDVNGHTVTKMNPRGEVQLVLGVKGRPGDWNEAANTKLLNEPTDVAIAPAGDIFVTSGHGQATPRVLRFDKNGAFIRAWGGKGTGPGQFDVAHSVVVDAKGLVYVADRQNRRVQIFDLDGNYVKAWPFAGLPCGLAIARDGQMYLVSGFAGQILKLDANGKALAATGQPGKALGQFGEAHYLTFGPKDDIYVADPAKPALHKFVKR
jgi:DNA-binding beta-propeller fold protein YncE